ncbi:hypothetical protein VTJ83DRAFT_5619 [Remersonia thermophila]|uniref:Uncharacterized protein n=1 Tax=Remersonia thermophila TaxID=72144 RepID=A0ABR4D9J3_9PEZI
MPRDPPTFLTLPLELRLEIYSYLLVLPPPPPPETQQPIYRSPRFYTPSSTGQLSCKVYSDAKLHPQILTVNSQIYHEAAPILYTRNTFSPTWVFLAGRVTLLRYYHDYSSSDNHGQQRLLHHSHHHHGSAHRSSLAQQQQQSQKSRQQQPSYHQCYYTHTPYYLMEPRHTLQLDLIRRWHVPVCVDTSSSAVSKLKSAAARYLSGAEEVTLEVWGGRRSGAAAAGAEAGDGPADGATAGDEVLAPDILRRFEHVRRVRRARVVGDDGRGGLSKQGAVKVLGGLEGYVNWLEKIMMSSEPEEEEEDEACAWEGARTEVGWMPAGAVREVLLAGA